MFTILKYLNKSWKWKLRSCVTVLKEMFKFSLCYLQQRSFHDVFGWPHWLPGSSIVGEQLPQASLINLRRPQGARVSTQKVPVVESSALSNWQSGDEEIFAWVIPGRIYSKQKRMLLDLAESAASRCLKCTLWAHVKWCGPNLNDTLTPWDFVNMMPVSFFAKYISVCCPSVPARWSCFAIATRAFATFKTKLASAFRFGGKQKVSSPS